MPSSGISCSTHTVSYFIYRTIMTTSVIKGVESKNCFWISVSRQAIRAIHACLYFTTFTIYINLFFFFKEPLFTKAPTFSTDLKSGTFQKHVGQNFALLCLAQAFPVPLIRLVRYGFAKYFVA